MSGSSSDEPSASTSPPAPQPAPATGPAPAPPAPSGADLSVTVTRTGGFAGLPRAWQLSLTGADSDLSARLRDLAAQAAGVQASEPTAGAADGFRYDVLLHSAGGSSRVTAAEPALPPPLAELVDLVRRHGSPAETQP